MIIAVTTLLVRPGLAVLLINQFDLGLYGAWISLAADQLLRSLLVWIRFISGKWKSLRV